MILKYSLHIVILTGFHGIFIHGAHKTKLLGVKECENPTPPKCKADVAEGKIELYGRNLLNGTVIVKKNVIPFLNFRAGVEDDGKFNNYKLSYLKLTCKNILMKIILTAINLKFNDDTCEVPKGNYHFEGIDVNKLDHAVRSIPIREPGINRWQFSFYGAEGTYVCFVLRLELILLKPKPRKVSH